MYVSKKEVLEQIEDYEQQIRTPEFSYIVCQKQKKWDTELCMNQK